MVPWSAQAPPTRRLDGRWRYERRPGRGIALSYGHDASAAPAPPTPEPPPSPPPLDRRGTRVLCYCGTSFSFDGPSGVCPHCAQLAEWPTIGLVEREMRSDLDALLGPEQPVD